MQVQTAQITAKRTPVAYSVGDRNKISALSNWRLKDDEWIAIYEPDEHYRVRIVEDCKNGTPYWSVQIFREGEYRQTVTAAPTRIEACIRMILWLDDHPIILKKHDEDKDETSS